MDSYDLCIVNDYDILKTLECGVLRLDSRGVSCWTKVS